MIKFPIKMIYSKECLNHAVMDLQCVFKQQTTDIPMFMYIDDTGGVYLSDNAIEFGISGHTYIEQRHFLQEELNNDLKGQYVCLYPKEVHSPSLFLQVESSTFNYIHDYDGKSYYKGNYTVRVLSIDQFKILKSWGIYL